LNLKNMIDKNKNYKTQNESKVIIYSADAGGDFPIHGAIKEDGEDWEAATWTQDGQFYHRKKSHPFNLVEVKSFREDGTPLGIDALPTVEGYEVVYKGKAWNPSHDVQFIFTHTLGKRWDISQPDMLATPSGSHNSHYAELIPVKPKRVAFTSDSDMLSYGATTWVRNAQNPDQRHLVTGISNTGISFGYVGYNWADLFTGKWEYSNLHNAGSWHKFEKD